MSSENVRYTMPDGNIITVKLINGGSTIEPVSDNINNIHHHAFVDRSTGEKNILIRDREGFNQAAYVMQDDGEWKERPLNSKEQSYQSEEGELK